MSQKLENECYIDKKIVEHGCCWGSAIVRKCEPGKGMYGGDVEMICECGDENAEMIRDAINRLQRS